MRVNGLWHVDLKPSQQRQVSVVLLDECGQGDGWQILRVMPGVAHLSNQIEAVLIRHTQVADQHVRARHGKRLDGFADTARRGDDSADLFQHQDQYPPGVGFVVHDEHAQVIESDQRKMVGDWDGILRLTLASSDRLPSPFSPIRTARMGRRTVNVEPLPSPGLSASTVPPCASTMYLTMESPSPSPANLRRVLLSDWRKRSKTLGNSSELITCPLSLT